MAALELGVVGSPKFLLVGTGRFHFESVHRIEVVADPEKPNGVTQPSEVQTGKSVSLRSKTDYQDQILEGRRVQSCKRTNGFLAILNTQRLAENLHFSWLEGKVREKVFKRTTSK